MTCLVLIWHNIFNFQHAWLAKILTFFFQITEENYGATEVLELVPNGEDLSVNKSNR